MELPGVITSALLTVILATATAQGQSFPAKSIRIVTTTPGGGNDVFARLIAQGLTDIFNRQVIVDNRGGGILAIETAAKAPPDGYTLLLYSSGMWTLPLIQKISYDPVADFAPVSLVGTQPNVLVVHPSLPVRSVGELVALAKARPGQLNFASGANGSTPHIAAELFRTRAKINIVRINYKGASLGINALVGGEVDFMFPTAAAAAVQVKAGRLRALAVTSAQPSRLAPGLPTVAAAGLPGYESIAPFGVFAPAYTPAAIIRKLNEEIAKAVNRPDIKQRFFENGVEIVASSPEDLAARIKADMVTIARLVSEAGLRED